MKCPDIHVLKLNRADQEALEEIRNIQRAGNILEVAMPAGVFTAIFLSKDAIPVTYSIHSTDGVLFGRAMKTLPGIVRNRISRVAKFRILNGSLNHQQRQFWDAVDKGCSGF